MTINNSNVREKLLQLGSQKRYNFTAEYAIKLHIGMD